MKQKKVIHEWSKELTACQVEFSGSLPVVPRTVLTVAFARFSFFYWLWYLHEFPKQEPHEGFSPAKRSKTGFFTFMPKAAGDARKMENAVKELLKRACEDFLSWAEELREFVDKRLGPLREMGELIE